MLRLRMTTALQEDRQADQSGSRKQITRNATSAPIEAAPGRTMTDRGFQHTKATGHTGLPGGDIHDT